MVGEDYHISKGSVVIGLLVRTYRYIAWEKFSEAMCNGYINIRAIYSIGEV